MFPNWAKNILFLLVFMIAGLVLAIIIEGLSSGTELIPLNTAIEQLVTRMRAPFLTNFFVFVTNAGNPFILSAATVIASIFLAMKKRLYDAVVFLTVMAIAVTALAVFKHTFQITRPDSGIVDVGGWSFPSGHATIAVTFFFMLVLTFFSRMKTLKGKTALIASSIIGALLVCFSRLYLGAHWTLDILAGLALGLLSVSFTMLMFGVFLENRQSLRARIGL